MVRRSRPDEHQDIATILCNLANCHKAKGKCGQAVVLYEEALTMMRRLLPEDHPDIVKTLKSIALCYSRWGQHDKMMALREEALAAERRCRETTRPSPRP
jgi:tetratricopeptide (TPR) repeat protein